jgi:hypothetical protein
MSKPILIIKFPHTESQSQILEMKESGDRISEQLTDYHVLYLMDNRRDELEFQCLNSPHDETEFEQLKQELLESFNFKKNNI